MSERRAKQLRRIERHAVQSPTGRSIRQEELFPAEIRLEKTTRFTGPVPPPALLQEYEQVLPGSAERILVMAEEEGRARRSRGNRIHRISETGVYGAITICLAAIIAGAVLAYHGRDTAGIAAIVAALSSIVVVFVTRRRPPSAD